jgi:predicted nucleic-acid-binding protein
MKALDIKEVIQIFKSRNTKSLQYKTDVPYKFINNIVLAEAANFFDQNIKYTRDDLAEMLHSLKENRQYRFENRECIERALTLYQDSKLTFSECLKQTVNREYYCMENAAV